MPAGYEAGPSLGPVAYHPQYGYMYPVTPEVVSNSCRGLERAQPGHGHLELDVGHVHAGGDLDTPVSGEKIATGPDDMANYAQQSAYTSKIELLHSIQPMYEFFCILQLPR
jgi:hypothetical protein